MRTNKSLALDYFRRVKSGDLQGLLNLFSDDPVIYEPFSKLKYVTGKSAIQSFLRTVVMANTGLEHEIRIEKIGQKANENSAVVLVTLTKEILSLAGLHLNLNLQMKLKEEESRLLLLNLQIKRTGVYCDYGTNCYRYQVEPWTTCSV